MKAPIITAKNVKTHQGHEGIGVNADIYIDGVLAGHFYDSADGGEFDFDPNWVNGKRDPKAEAKIKELEAYAESLPERDLNADRDMGTKPLMHKDHYTDLMDNVINEVIKKREDAKIAKMRMKYVMYGVPGSPTYRYISWKGKTLADLSATERGRQVLQAEIIKLQKEFTGKTEILNAKELRSLGYTV